MSSSGDAQDRPPDLAVSGVTIPSDSENYGNNELSTSPSPPSTDSSPLILYQPPTIWSLLRGAAINMFLPFINGLMIGFGELFAHEIAFRLGWSTERVWLPPNPIGPIPRADAYTASGLSKWTDYKIRRTWSGGRGKPNRGKTPSGKPRRYDQSGVTGVSQRAWGNVRSSWLSVMSGESFVAFATT